MHRKYIEKLVIEMYRDEYIIYKTYPGKNLLLLSTDHPSIHLPIPAVVHGRAHPAKGGEEGTTSLMGNESWGRG
jgi:hypothetical protein